MKDFLKLLMLFFFLGCQSNIEKNEVKMFFSKVLTDGKVMIAFENKRFSHNKKENYYVYYDDFQNDTLFINQNNKRYNNFSIIKVDEKEFSIKGQKLMVEKFICDMYSDISVFYISNTYGIILEHSIGHNSISLFDYENTQIVLQSKDAFKKHELEYNVDVTNNYPKF